MRDGEVSFAFAPSLLDVAPVVVRTPGDAAAESRLERDGTRAEVAAQGHSLEPDTPRIDVVPLFEPVDDAAGPVLAVVSRSHVVQAQGLTGARLIDDERRNAAAREPGRKADAVAHLLGGIEPVDLHQDRRPAVHAVSANVECGEVPAFIGNLHALAVLVGERQALGEDLQYAAIKAHPTFGSVRLQAFGSQQVDGRPIQLLAGRAQPSARLVVVGERAELVGHPDPGFPEGSGAGSIGGGGRVLERCAHLLDLADPCAHLDGEIHRQVPDVVGREVLEHAWLSEIGRARPRTLAFGRVRVTRPGG